MSNIPAELKYVDPPTNGCVLEADGTITVGITDHAQELLGDVVLRRAAGSGRQSGCRGAEAGVVESVKAASDVYAPIAGEIVASQPGTELDANPEKANQRSIRREAWFFKHQARKRQCP